MSETFKVSREVFPLTVKVLVGFVVPIPTNPVEVVVITVPPAPTLNDPSVLPAPIRVLAAPTCRSPPINALLSA